MAFDSKIFKIALLASAAIIAPVATIVIQEELDDFEYEGDIELTFAEIKEQEQKIELQEEQLAKVIPEPAPIKPATPLKKIRWKKGRRFKTLEDCRRFYKTCKNRKTGVLMQKIVY